jgi:hexosaminidase
MFRLVLMLTLLGSAEAAPAAISPVMPLPVKMEGGAGRLAIDGSFTVLATSYSDVRLESAMRRLAQRVSRQTGIPMLGNKPADPSRATLRVECAGRGSDYPSLEEDESYQLDVTPDSAVVKAATTDGALHGMETFAQLISETADGFQVAAVHIEDRPRFPWRGLMLDVSRHWMPVEVVERNLDAMAAVKLNVFHWHLSDDQGLRVESRRFPRLQQYGSDGNYYTQDEIRHIVAYARDRGIRVVPEFDIPGHTTSWFPGYPELASAPGPYEIGRHFGIFDPAMDPAREETYTFLDSFIGEMAQLFPDPYFHIGGDEVNGKQWKQSSAIQAFATEHHLDGVNGLQVYFNQRILKIVEKHGKTMIGWDEILHPDLPKATVVQTWRNQKSLAESAAKGYRAILSWGYYLDHLSPASYHYGVDPLGGAADSLSPEQASHVLGGEACLWSELVSSETVDSRTWPRAAAIAERFWSAASVTDVDSMYARLDAVSRYLGWTGLQHRAGYAPMLDRLANNRPSDPVRVLGDACDALGLGPRSDHRNTTLTPLNRFVDAVRPESESVRAMQQMAARVAGTNPPNPADVAELRLKFTVWAANDTRFQALAENNALLAEIKPLSKDLSALGAIGLRVLDYLAGGQAPPAGWIADRGEELGRMEKPTAEVKLAAVRPVKVLLEGLAKRHS